MSSFTGSAVDKKDADLQLAPAPNEGPDFATLKEAYESCINNQQSFVDQCRANYCCRFALWPGQSSDGKKWSREGSKIDPTPWQGASDLRVYEVDGAINRKVALYRTAFKKANLVATPAEGNDFKRARIVSNFMRWLIHTQIPDVDREVELLANYINEKGLAATGQFWETKQEKTLASVSLEQLQSKFPDLDMMALLSDPTASDQLAGIFEEQYGCSNGKAKRMIKDLLKAGKTTVPTLGRKRSYPVLRAFALDEQLFIPAETTDLEKASGIYRVEYYTPEKLRALVDSDGWNKEWVEKAIETCRGKVLTYTPSQFAQPINRSFVYQQQPIVNKDQIGVVFAYQRLSDEDGVAGIYLTIFNPEMGPDESQPGYAKFGLLEYAHGQYPFTLFRREYLTRRLHDSRGIPEPGKSWQDIIKAHRDGRIDAASIAIIPPMGFPMGRPPSRWGPGARIPERRPGEFHFMDRPTSDPLTEQSEAIMSESFKDYNGFASKDSDPQYVQAITQNEIDKFLTQLAKAFTQIYSLYGQYGDDRVTFRVMGVKDPAALEYVKGDINENFDMWMIFDVQSTDMDKMEVRWKAIIDGIQLLNREGNVNFAETLQAYVESIDPQIAERIIEPVQQAQEKLMKDEVDDLTKLYAGWNVGLKQGTPPQIAQQAIQTWMQSKDVQQKYQTDQPFKERVDARMKMIQFQQSQEQNKIIGRQGGVMPGPEVPH